VESKYDECKRMLRNYTILLKCADSPNDKERFQKKIEFYTAQLLDLGYKKKRMD